MRKEYKYLIVSFLLAFILWYFVVWGKPIEKNVPITLEPKIANSERFQVELNPTQVELKIEATRSNLRLIDLNSLKIELDLTRYSSGVHQVRIPIENIKFSNNVKIKEVSPSFVMVIIKKITSKMVPVRVQFDDEVDQRPIKISIIPAFVRLNGLWEDLKDIKEVKTVPVSIEDLKKEKVVFALVNKPFDNVEVVPEKVKIMMIYSK